MIEFVTLFLGLVVGDQPVEVAVGPEVASVEILLDGHSVGTLTGAPWTGTCDFGDELAPHELVAIARDAGGQELGRARQLLNLPRERAEARFAITREKERGPPTARLIWEALDFDRPAAVHVFFDGKQLPAADLNRIELPRHDPQSIHFLYAELTFSDVVEAHAELAFGGVYGDQVATELTAVTIGLERDRRPRREKMQGWLRKDGQPLRVVAVEKGPVELLIVRENSAATIEGLHHLMRTRAKMTHYRRSDEEVLRIRRRDRVRLVFPFAERHEKSAFEMLPVSQDLSSYGEGVLFNILTGIFFPEEDEPVAANRLADAVAIAGLEAAAVTRRRAVVLVYAGDSSDTSRLRPHSVRPYLRRLGVPLLVWALPAEGGRVPSAWGEEVEVRTLADMRLAVRELRQVLKLQLTVWLEGAHLPGEVELAPQASGIRLLE